MKIFSNLECLELTKTAVSASHVAIRCFSFQSITVKLLFSRNNTKYYKSIEKTLYHLRLLLVNYKNYFLWLHLFLVGDFTLRLCNWASVLNLKVFFRYLRPNCWVSYQFFVPQLYRLNRSSFPDNYLLFAWFGVSLTFVCWLDDGSRMENVLVALIW